MVGHNYHKQIKMLQYPWSEGRTDRRERDVFFFQANARPVGPTVRFTPCQLEFESPHWRIYWLEEVQFICTLKI